MASFDLATLARRRRNIRRKIIVLRDIVPTTIMATNLYTIYARMLSAWDAALPRIISTYERTLSEMTTDSPTDVAQEVEDAGSAINRLLLILTPEVRDWAIGVEQWQRSKWISTVLSGTGVDLSTFIGASDARMTLETAINWNVSLISNVSQQAQQRISNAVFDGLRNNNPPRELAKDLREAVTMGRDQAMRRASDQLNKLSASLADERRRQAGLPVWKWVHSRKLHPRQTHIDRDGHLYSDDPELVGKVVDGKTIMAPPKDLPGQLPYCGCRSQSVLVFFN
ncbi:MAG: hypothetical protein EP345_17550 [Sphingomonadales bacterium]|nr:MAG: hypothetical protein EP345_17550 [Sphingomonadales bacterium]